MKRGISFTTMILVIWMVIVLVAVGFAKGFTTEELSPVYDTMIEAADLAQSAMDEIKSEKLRRGIELNPKDILETGMIGLDYSSITTTRGVLEAKRTSTNPNWAAVAVGMFKEANLKRGDQIAMVFSGSFPALNISVMAAAQAYGLEQCVMASVGASTYGANIEDFTFFDMAEHLYANGFLAHRLDYVSLGGDLDIGRDFYDDVKKQQILTRIEQSGITFINQPDFEENITLRLQYIKEKVPSIKFIINVGGSLVGLGTGLNAFLKTGFVSPGLGNSSAVTFWGTRVKGCGLLQYFLGQGLPVASLLNIKGLAVTYGIPYDPTEKPQIGAGNVYYTSAYNPIVPAIALVLSAGICAYLVYYVRRIKIDARKYERNYILYRR